MPPALRSDRTRAGRVSTLSVFDLAIALPGHHAANAQVACFRNALGQFGRGERLLKGYCVKPVCLAPRSQNLNAFAERFVRTIKETRLIGPLTKAGLADGGVSCRERLG